MLYASHRPDAQSVRKARCSLKFSTDFSRAIKGH